MHTNRTQAVGITADAPRSGISSATLLLLKSLSLLAIIVATLTAFWYATQPPLEQYPFRQTQTALTSFWFIKEGFQLAYQTPVAGAPWSIPFEFPLYQYLAAVSAQAFHTDLTATGRIISFIFLLLCIPPAASICRKLDLPKQTIYIFIPILMGSPLYLLWGRTFMIETAAVFFTVAAINAFIDYICRRTLKSALFFALLISISALQKATTALPVLAVLSIVLLIHELKKTGITGVFTTKNIFHAAILFAIPLAICIAWTTYTDIIKMSNPLGSQLTSSALSKWNWGTLEQRFSEKLYSTVIWERIFRDNLAGIVGIASIGLGLLVSAPRTRVIIIISTTLGLLPLFIFTNLHIIHSYYQTANVLFLIFALAVALAEPLSTSRRPATFAALLVVILGINYTTFYNGSYKDLTKVFTLDDRDMLISAIIKYNTRATDSTLIFGNDWSSSIAFLSERKSFTAPTWMKGYANILQDPESYLGDTSLGAVVLCPQASNPTPTELLNWSANRGWKITQAAGCYIALPNKTQLPDARLSAPSQCEGNLEYAKWADDDLDRIFIAGWTATKTRTPEAVYISLANADGIISLYEAVPVPRPDVDQYLGKNDQPPAGFTLLVPAAKSPEPYRVGVVKLEEGRLQTCQFTQSIPSGMNH